MQTRGSASRELGDRAERNSLSPRESGKATFDVESATSSLSQIVGDNNIFSTPNDCVISVAPGSIIEVSEVMKLASSEGWIVVPAGGESWLDLGNPRRLINLIVSTRRLNRIIEHEPADLVAVTEAGVTLTDFNATLARNGQWLPLDPPDDGRATIGGIVATGFGGAQQYGYGRPRGSVIGMRVVLADGKVIKAGGRVVKNVAGYDLCKSFTGSYGTLGIIAEVNFKLRPRPICETTIVAEGQPDILISRAQTMLTSRLFPVAAELVSSRLANLLGIATDEHSAVLLVRFAGNEKGVEYQVKEALSHLGRDSGTKQTEAIVDDALVWQKLAAVPLQAKEPFCWRASVLPAELAKFFDAVRTILGKDFASCIWQLGVADGRLRVLSNPGNVEETIKQVKGLRGSACSAGGMFMVEKIDEEIGPYVNAWEETSSAKHLADRIKSQLDPQGILPFLQIQ